MSEALADIAAERRRQIEVEGWTPEHDDRYEQSELADAAACYAAPGAVTSVVPESVLATDSRRLYWPWDWKWWKPGNDRRRRLVKAGALIVAEIERLDRATPSSGRPL